MKPTDDTIALAAFLLGREWICADEIAHAVARLGFEKPTAQQIAGRLTAMCRESSPRFERRQVSTGLFHEYRVTHWAHTGLSNTWPGFTTREYERRLHEISAAITQPVSEPPESSREGEG